MDTGSKQGLSKEKAAIVLGIGLPPAKQIFSQTLSGNRYDGRRALILIKRPEIFQLQD